MKTFMIQYDQDWGEFQVLHPTNKEATYHTDDKQDAIDTCHHMARTEFGLKQGEYKIKHKQVSTGDLNTMFAR